MSGKTILSVANPLTQSAKAVKQLIAYYHHDQEPTAKWAGSMNWHVDPSEFKVVT